MSARPRPQIKALIIQFSDGSETSIETDQQSLQWTLDLESEFFEGPPRGGYKTFAMGARTKLKLVVTGYALTSAHHGKCAITVDELRSAGDATLPLLVQPALPPGEET